MAPPRVASNWPMVPSTSGWPAWPIKNTSRASRGIARDLHVHLGHQRAGGVENIELPPLRLLLHDPRHAVGGEDHRGAVRHLVQFVDEDRADDAQPVHHVLVMNHLVPHIDGCAEQRDCALDDVDGAVHAGAETARIGEKICISVSASLRAGHPQQQRGADGDRRISHIECRKVRTIPSESE